MKNPRKRPSSLPSPPSSKPLRKKAKPNLPPSEGCLSDRPREVATELFPIPRDTESFSNQKRQWNGEQEQDPLHHWVINGSWPVYFGTMSGQSSENSGKRRRSSTPSYSSRERDGSVPRAHSPAYEEQLQRHGIMFDDSVTKNLVLTQSRRMCEDLLSVDTFAPAYNSCSEQIYGRLYHRATKCSEERVRRDLTPHIVPSAELLYLVNGETTLEHVREEMSVDWTKCSLLGGTQPRPDYAFGLSSATFTEAERAKIENYTNIDSPTKFTESLYFPFLLCEAKCGRKNINEADRQNIHSASIAVKAIVQLCRSSGDDSVSDLHGQILVFSISHDNEKAKIYGHFPLFRDGQTTWHRYHIHEYSLYGHYGQDRDKGSNFTRAVYRDFYPIHLRRIREAIARLPDPRTTSTTSDISIGGSDPQAGERSSQEADPQARPTIRRAKSQGSHKELALMKQTIARMEKMHKDQLEQQQKQIEQQQKQMEQQREDSQKQIALLERLLASQK